jgi:acetoacetyl-[acyl-carrier protein] synthase
MDAAFLNSKGFGGNNATGVVLAPHVTRAMLEKRHGRDAMKRWEAGQERVVEAVAAYDARMTRGEVAPIYRFGEGVLDGPDLTIDPSEIRIPGFARGVRLDAPNPWSDMVD